MNTSIEVEEDRNSTELTVTGKIEEDSVDFSDAEIDNEAILERIQEELLKGIANRIDYAS